MFTFSYFRKNPGFLAGTFKSAKSTIKRFALLNFDFRHLYPSLPIRLMGCYCTLINYKLEPSICQFLFSNLSITCFIYCRKSIVCREWRPSHFSAADNVRMEMEYGLACLFTRINDKAEAVFLQSFCFGNLLMTRKSQQSFYCILHQMQECYPHASSGSPEYEQVRRVQYP